MAKSWNDVRTRQGKWTDKVHWFKFDPEKEFHSLRFVGFSKLKEHVQVSAFHWIRLNPEDPTSKKMFQVPCTAFDPASEEYSHPELCACHKHLQGTKWMTKHQATINGKEFSWTPVTTEIRYFTNVIPMAIWDDKPAVMKPDWTPVRGLSIPPGAAEEIQKEVKRASIVVADDKMAKEFGLGDDHIGKKIIVDPAHPKYGFLIDGMYDSSAAPAKKYSFRKGDPNILTAEMESFKLYDFYSLIEPMPISEIERSLRRIGYIAGGVSVGGIGKDEDDDDVPGAPEEEEAPVVAEEAPVSEPPKATPAPVVEAPKAAPAPVQETPAPVAPKAVATPEAGTKKPDDCPADFGKFAGKTRCFRCPVKSKCVDNTQGPA